MIKKKQACYKKANNVHRQPGFKFKKKNKGKMGGHKLCVYKK